MAATQTEIADHLDLSLTKISELVRRNVIPRGADLTEARVSYIRHLRKVAAGHSSSGEDGEVIDLTAERARLTRAQAEERELKNGELRGELIPRGDHESTLISLASAVAMRLDAIPSKAAPAARATETDAEAEAVLRRHVDETRVELADMGRNLLARIGVAPVGDGGVERGAGRVPAAAAADDKRVGGRRKKA